MEMATRLEGSVQIPGDKSISHRALMIGAISEGKTVIDGLLMADDCLRTIKALKQCGVLIQSQQDGSFLVHGRGLQGMVEPTGIINAGNSGTTLRLMLGLMSGQKMTTFFSGDRSLRNRPMLRVTEPLQQMGAVILGREDGRYAPLGIKGGSLRALQGYSIPVASAQVKSALILAALNAEGTTSIRELKQTRDHTENLLRASGAQIELSSGTIYITGGVPIYGQRIKVPGDFSSAAFLLGAAAVVRGSHVMVCDVGVNPTRTGFLDVLRLMGADVITTNQRQFNGEPVADITIKGGQLRGVQIIPEMVPGMIDEIPVWAVIASLSEGVSTLSGASELRIKESDRIKSMVWQLSKLGADIRETQDGMIITGREYLTGGSVKSGNDHRVAMALAVAGLRGQKPTVIKDAHCVDISFPGFKDTLSSLLRI